MSDWEDIANALWNDIRRWVQNQKDSGHTLASIAEKIGVKNRSHISLWLSGERKADQASFAKLMEYAEGAGLDYRNYFPKPTSQVPQSETDGDRIEALEKQNAELESTVAKLQAELAATRSERDMARGEVRALERQLARLTPTHEERNESLPDSTGDIRGEAVRAG